MTTSSSGESASSDQSGDRDVERSFERVVQAVERLSAFDVGLLFMAARIGHQSREAVGVRLRLRLGAGGVADVLEPHPVANDDATGDGAVRANDGVGHDRTRRRRGPVRQ